MLKTTNYNLNKPEVTDPLRVADFNENADKIDAALASKAEKSVVTAVESALGSKANATDLTALSTALANKGNCKIVHGNYTGTGNYGYRYSNALTFEFKPILVLVVGGSEIMHILQGVPVALGANCTVTWSENSVSWYNNYTDAAQFNSADISYFYVAVGV